MIKSTLVVGVLTLVSRILGFVRDAVIGASFGADAATDAFFVAFRIPNFMRRLFGEGSFSQAFIPVLADYKENRAPHALRRFIEQTAGSLCAALAAATLLGILSAPLLVAVFAPGFVGHAGAFDLTVDLLRITFPYGWLISLTAFAAAILHTHQRFAVPAFTPVLLNLALIAAALWAAPRWGEPVYALAWGVLMAGVLQLALQITALRGIGLPTRLRLGFHDPGVRRVMQLMGPALFSGSVTQINGLINTLMASFLVTGSVSWLYYSDRLVEFPLGLFGVAIGVVILPHLSRFHVLAEADNFSHALDWALRWVLLLAPPATLGLILLAEPLLYTLFQYDRFSAEDVVMSSRSLMAYALGLLGLLPARILIAGFGARQDYRTPVRYALYAIGINLSASLSLVLFLAPPGWLHAALAFSTALAAIANAACLLAGLSRAGVFRPAAGWGSFAARVGLASGLMAALLIAQVPGADHWQSWNAAERVGHLALWVLAGAASYGLCLIASGLRPRHLLLRSGG